MKLVYDETGNEVKVGDVVKTFRGETCTVMGITKPHKPASTGRVAVQLAATRDTNCTQEFFPCVINATWINRED